MCNDQIYTESGAPIAPTRCAEYGKLKAENEVLREALNTAELTAANANSCRDDPWKILADIENCIGNALKEVG